MRCKQFFLLTIGTILSIFLGHSLQYDAPFLKKEYPLRVEDAQSRTRHIFAQIIKSAKEKKWESLPIGECIGNIGLLMVGTEYVAGTIEGEGPEICRVDLTGLDCVTFYENVLCTARILKKGNTTYDDLIAELTLTRYRGGKLTDYTSRLHYTSDWIYDNEKKKVVRNITRKIGGKEYPIEVSFMSKNPGYYPALKEFPEFIKTIAKFEKEINKRRHWYISKRKVRKAQRHIRTGDIIVLATNREGLDYAHTGLAYRDEKGNVRFLHASSEKKKVMLDTELYKYIQSVDTFIGITVARPQEVRYP